ncbi:MAG: diaminopimelate decarboxylase [Proteobacteria bacterium]|nr:diaminopimelate decarboxylase [Pseudomonadota bacterium]
MDPFRYRDGELCAEEVPLADIAARYGTPTYVYSRAAIEAAFREYTAAFAGTPHLVCYALKANSNLAILALLARLGAGFDIVSGGELARVLHAGGDPAKIVFSGVGKTDTEIVAALAAGILCFNVESASELERIAAIAAREGRRAPVSLRVNPHVDARTHPYIATGLAESKFGIAHTAAPELYRRAAAMPSLAVRGIDCHIGSQVLDLDAYVETAARMFELVDTLAAEGIVLEHVDLGGGLGVRYRDDDTPIVLARYADAVRAARGAREVKLLFEPGRRLVGEAGVLLTRVLYLKPGEAKHFAIVDAAMNDLLRPALYAAWHGVDPVRPRAGATTVYDVVGPVCESGDFLAEARALALAEGDLLAVRTAGAYGMAMSSNYNSRPRACEVLVDGAHAHVVRERERIDALWNGEHVAR